MPNEKISGFLGLCRKAGKLVMGFDICVEALGKGKAELLLLARDCSERTVRGIKRAAEEKGREVRTLPLNMDEISFAVAKRAGVLAVCDSGFAKKFKELLDGMHTA